MEEKNLTTLTVLELAFLVFSFDQQEVGCSSGKLRLSHFHINVGTSKWGIHPQMTKSVYYISLGIVTCMF